VLPTGLRGGGRPFGRPGDGDFHRDHPTGGAWRISWAFATWGRGFQGYGFRRGTVRFLAPCGFVIMLQKLPLQPPGSSP